MKNQNNKAIAFQHKRQEQVTQNIAEPIKINPKFDDLQQPETLLNHVQDLQRELKAKQNHFPVRPRACWISSTQNRMPCSLQIS